MTKSTDESNINPQADYVPDGDGAGVRLGGVPNARGIGGYPTEDGHRLRDGLFFRSAGLNFLGSHGLDDLRALGVKEVVDLRDPMEAKLWPYTLPSDIHVENIPLIKRDNTGIDMDAAMKASDGGDSQAAKDAMNAVSMEDMYHGIVAGSGREIVGILKKLLDSQTRPMLIHCTAGKDRTGITSGVLMSLLGVGDDLVVSCYAKSGSNLGETFAKEVVGDLAGDAGGAGQVSAARTAALTSPPSLMRGVLTQIREDYGSAEEYCIKNGMTPEDVAALRALFVE